MAYQRHRDGKGRWTGGKHCANHRAKRNPQLSAFDKLERKVAKNERAAHPSYGKARVEYIARAVAGKVAREHGKH